MKSFHYYGESGEKVKDNTTTAKHPITLTILVDTSVHPGFWINTGYQWN